MELVEKDIKVSDILTKEALENAIVVHSAIGGSTNATLHLPAIARELGIYLEPELFDEINHRVPHLGNITPSGEHLTEAFWFAGGIPMVELELRDMLHLDVMTVTGKTLGENLEELKCFVGPPLAQQFAKFCGFSDEKGHQMVEFYREYYEGKGMLENAVYDGIPEVLEQLKNAGIRLAVATSKPEKYARKIAEHFKIAPYFEFIGGANMDGSRTKKAEVIEYVLKNCKVEDRQSVLMVGDREHDILGAKACKVSALGVLYGYGDRAELEDAGADWIVSTPAKITEKILGRE